MNMKPETAWITNYHDAMIGQKVLMRLSPAWRYKKTSMLRYLEHDDDDLYEAVWGVLDNITTLQNIVVGAKDDHFVYVFGEYYFHCNTVRDITLCPERPYDGKIQVWQVTPTGIVETTRHNPIFFTDKRPIKLGFNDSSLVA